MISLTKVVVDDLYETIHGYVTKRELIVDDYEAMIEVILSMIKDGYCFAMDRDILRDAMESLTYMYAPSDDMNKDRLVQQFADEEEEDSDDDEESGEDEGDFNNMDLMKMMQMMGGMGGMGGMGAPSENSEEKCPEGTCELESCEGGVCDEGECKKVVTETTDSTGEDPTTTTVVKEDIVVEDVEDVEDSAAAKDAIADDAKVNEETSSTPVNDDGTPGAE